MQFRYRLSMKCKLGPTENETIRTAVIMSFDSRNTSAAVEDVPRQVREKCLRAVVEWGILHPSHPNLPEWAGKSYLPIVVLIDDVPDDKLPILREELEKAGVQFMDEVMADLTLDGESDAEA